MRRYFAAIAACAGMLALAAADMALAQNQTNPIPGIDVVVKKQPAGTAITVGACQSGGGKVVKRGSQWVCTGLPATTTTKQKQR